MLLQLSTYLELNHHKRISYYPNDYNENLFSLLSYDMIYTRLRYDKGLPILSKSMFIKIGLAYNMWSKFLCVYQISLFLFFNAAGIEIVNDFGSLNT